MCVCRKRVGTCVYNLWVAAAAVAAALGTDYGIWIRCGPGWRRKAVDDGSAAEPGEKRRRMKVKTKDSARFVVLRCEREDASPTGERRRRMREEDARRKANDVLNSSRERISFFFLP